MDPARVYSFSRSRYISASWSSSTIPTLVSCGVEDTNNSFVMQTPVATAMRPQNSPDWRQERTGRIERCDGRPQKRTASASEESQRPNRLHKLESLLH